MRVRLRRAILAREFGFFSRSDCCQRSGNWPTNRTGSSQVARKLSRPWCGLEKVRFMTTAVRTNQKCARSSRLSIWKPLFACYDPLGFVRGHRVRWLNVSHTCKAMRATAVGTQSSVRAPRMLKLPFGPEALRIRPPLKWAGGKRWQVRHLHDNLETTQSSKTGRTVLRRSRYYTRTGTFLRTT